MSLFVSISPSNHREEVYISARRDVKEVNSFTILVTPWVYAPSANADNTLPLPPLLLARDILKPPLEIKNQLPAPLPDLVGMDAILTRDLSKRLLPLGGFESDFGFECSVMLSAHSDHLTIPPLGLWQVKMHLIALSEIWGEAQFAQSEYNHLLEQHLRLIQLSTQYCKYFCFSFFHL